MTDTLQTFDAGTVGANVTGGTNGVASVVSGTPTYATGIHGTAALRAGAPANTTNTRLKLALGLTGNHYGSLYMKNTTAHGSGTANEFFFRLATAANVFIAEFRANPGNALSVRDSTGVQVRAGTSGEIPVNAVFRLDWHLNGTTLDWRLYKTDPEAAHTTTPDYSGTVTVSGTADNVLVGAESTSSVPKDWTFDTFRASNTATDWYDGFSPPAGPPAGPTMKVWDGTTEVTCAVTVWNGTTEVVPTSITTV